MCLFHSPSTSWRFPCTPDPCTYERARGAEQRQIERVENKYKCSLKIKSNHSFDAALRFQLPCPPSIAVLPFKFARASRVVFGFQDQKAFQSCTGEAVVDFRYFRKASWRGISGAGSHIQPSETGIKVVGWLFMVLMCLLHPKQQEKQIQELKCTMYTQKRRKYRCVAL